MDKINLDKKHNTESPHLKALKIINDTQSGAIKKLSVKENKMPEENKFINISDAALSAQKNESAENIISELFNSVNAKTLSDYYFLAPLFQDNLLEKEIRDRISAEDYEKLNKNFLVKIGGGEFQASSVMHIKITAKKNNINHRLASQEIFNLNSLVIPIITDILKKRNSFIANTGNDFISAVFGIIQKNSVLPNLVNAISSSILILKIISKFSDEIQKLTGVFPSLSVGVSAGFIKTGYIGKCGTSEFHIAGVPLLEAKEIAENCFENEIGISECAAETAEEYFTLNQEYILTKNKNKFYKIVFF